MSVLQILANNISALVIIGGALFWAARKVRPLLQMGDDWRGEPARRGPTGIEVAPARRSVMERLTALEREVASIQKEMHPNGGTSFRDRVELAIEQPRPRVEAGGGEHSVR